MRALPYCVHKLCYVPINPVEGTGQQKEEPQLENPHEYDDDRYTSASNDLFSAVSSLWEASADEQDIQSQFDQALEAAQGE